MCRLVTSSATMFWLEPDTDPWILTLLLLSNSSIIMKVLKQWQIARLEFSSPKTKCDNDLTRNLLRLFHAVNDENMKNQLSTVMMLDCQTVRSCHAFSLHDYDKQYWVHQPGCEDYSWSLNPLQTCISEMELSGPLVNAKIVCGFRGGFPFDWHHSHPSRLKLNI